MERDQLHSFLCEGRPCWNDCPPDNSFGSSSCMEILTNRGITPEQMFDIWGIDEENIQAWQSLGVGMNFREVD